MAGPLADSSKTASKPRLHVARCYGLLLLLPAEVLCLTMIFDGKFVDERAHWWSWYVAHAAVAPQLLAVIAGAVVLVVGTQRRNQALSEFLEATAAHGSLKALIVHVAAFAGFAFVSGQVLTDKLQSLPYPTLWVLSWGTLAIITFASWGALLAPAEFWRRLLLREHWAITCGIGIGTAAWGLGRLTQTLWLPLGSVTFLAVEWLLGVCYPVVVSDPQEMTLGTPAFLVTIAPQCSGYEGIGLICVFLAAFCWTFREDLRFPQAWLLWPVGIIGIWICNVLRITALVAIGSSYSREVAFGGFHSQAGWIALIVTSLCLSGGALRSPYFAKLRVEHGAGSQRVAATDYLAPFLVMMGVQMLAAAFSSGFDRLYPLKVAALLVACVTFGSAYRKTEWGLSGRALLNGCAVFLLWIAFPPPHAESAGSLPMSLQGLAPFSVGIWLFCRIIGSVVLVPLVEEFAFRGYLMRRIAAQNFEAVSFARCSWISVVLSSCLFGLLHGRWLAGTLAGLSYSLAARRRDRLSDAVVAHATTNALIAADVLYCGAWWLW